MLIESRGFNLTPQRNRATTPPIYLFKTENQYLTFEFIREKFLVVQS